MCLEIQLASARIGYVRVQLGRREVRVAEHLLDAPQVGAALEEVRRERVPEQVGVDALGLETGLGGEPSQDQEDARTRERASLRVQEELRSVAPVEVRTAAREVAPQRLRGASADRDESLLRALADGANHAL